MIALTTWGNYWVSEIIWLCLTKWKTQTLEAEMFVLMLSSGPV